MALGVNEVGIIEGDPVRYGAGACVGAGVMCSMDGALVGLGVLTLVGGEVPGGVNVGAELGT